MKERLTSSVVILALAFAWATQIGGCGGGTGSFRPPPPAPSVFNLLSPAMSSSGQPVQTTFSWSASAGAESYRLQISQQPTFSPIAVEYGSITATSFTLPTALTGGTVYFWRVYAGNRGGETVASPVASSFGTLQVIPGDFTLVSPAHLATNVDPGSIVFQWTASTNAASYTLQYSTVSTFPATLDTVTVTGLTQTSHAPTVSFGNAMTYFWRVTAINGSATKISTTFSFQTSGSGGGLPGDFSLSSPTNGARTSTQPIFRWSAAAGAQSYTLQIATNSTFKSSTTYPNLTNTSYSLTGPLLEDTTYFWRVYAVNASGSKLCRDGYWSFLTSLIKLQ